MRETQHLQVPSLGCWVSRKGSTQPTPLYVGNSCAPAPIAWRFRPCMLSPRRSPGAGANSESSVKSMTDPSPAQSDRASLFTASLAETDPEIADVVRRELGRQRDEIELIASENIVSKAALEAQGSVLTNNYAAGLPGRRYYRAPHNVHSPPPPSPSP